MSANVELVKTVLPAEIDVARVFQSEDPLAMLIANADVLSPDLEIEWAGSHAGAPALHYKGPEGLLEGWRDWLIPWESYMLETEDVLDAGDHVVSLVRVRAKTSRHGVEIEHRPA